MCVTQVETPSLTGPCGRRRAKQTAPADTPAPFTDELTQTLPTRVTTGLNTASSRPISRITEHRDQPADQPRHNGTERREQPAHQPRHNGTEHREQPADQPRHNRTEHREQPADQPAHRIVALREGTAPKCRPFHIQAKGHRNLTVDTYGAVDNVGHDVPVLMAVII